jgi:hypothetical protein
LVLNDGIAGDYKTGLQGSGKECDFGKHLGNIGMNVGLERVTDSREGGWWLKRRCGSNLISTSTSSQVPIRNVMKHKGSGSSSTEQRSVYN